MKQTTKIILGIISGIFLISLAFIIGFSFSNRRNWQWIDNSVVSMIEFSQENKTEIEIGSFQTVCLDNEDNGEFKFFPFGSFSIKPISPEIGKQQLIVPDDLKKYLNVTNRNDTLFIRLNRKKMLDGEKLSNPNYLNISGMNLDLHTSAIDIINNSTVFKIDIRMAQTDRIKINNSESVTIESCTANEVTLLSKGNIEINNSTIKKLNLDLDNIGGWSVNQSQIDLLNLSGSREHQASISKTEFKSANWTPKNENATLNLGIKGSAARIILE